MIENRESDSPRLVLRPAVAADARTLLGFIHELAEFEELADQVVVDERSLMQALFVDNPVSEAVVAELNREPIGFALFFRSFSTFLGRAGLYLEDLYVRPEHRGHGVGKALLRHLARIAVERGCGRLEWAVLNWNRSAIEFYERLGAVSMSDWTTYRLAGPALADFAR